ncbi:MULTISPECIES: ECF-type sigma factor [unclassified Lysobacter]|uniref:ECF-type sigma factor n=1 Tax=unclassified Lysobacter TaxID=2635362 RepID=UPI001BEB57B6|nr:MULTISPECIES: ECF-type sigma factor [unclassified Lysobacter]MBT2750227.1 sigma-70 family RNA polymerase sigma factor [Lysobacter sp. ISL-50]MBT2775202.1 sigma-70 family RNA polymerase sigma factor [Lysobacter sp. ISL-54]MBT2782575.1 sigma-70 family RNA polymerase sigma factor [Lysobacter sp. ISL-52]
MTDEATKGDVTRLLHAWNGGDSDARDALYRLVYGELKGIALRRLAHIGRSVIDPTELVNEALLRLLDDKLDAQNRQHFFRIAATAIRYTLIDVIRQRQADKRGGEVIITSLDSTLGQNQAAAPADQRWMEVEQALVALDEAYPRQCRVIELAFLVGLKQHEIAEALAVNVRTVERDLSFAKAWLREYLSP